ncbi:hypothetical protein [Sediminibacterium sp.]|uniref:hypothetical protein n=1 Tax=Sediminibacterium sp. TaxID=1917865 RepID=UPI0025E12694|nr:hypothetical protein [Sediminibacterium sp.]MBW0176591.1 hypothetical protein [Sediminibacterium sp.]
MKKKNKVSLLLTLLLVVTSFFPVIQVMIMSLNGALIEFFRNILSYNGSDSLLYFINTLLGLVTCVLFVLSKTVIQKVLSGLGVILFFLPLIIYLLEGRVDSDSFYFLQFLIGGIVIGGVLIILETLQRK